MSTPSVSTFPILFVKALKNQTGYALYGNPPRWHKVGGDKQAPADAHHVAVSHYHVAAVKKLQADGKLHGLAPHEQSAKVKGLAAELQAAASQSAAVSMWKKTASEGKNPTPAQWKAFYALPKDKQSELLGQIGQATGAQWSHLSPPDEAKPVAPEPPKPDPATLALAAVDWAGMTLPDTNVNAGTVNKKLAALKDAAATGDAEKVAALKFGVNTYGKKLSAAQAKILAALGAPAPEAAPAPKVAKVEATSPAPVAPAAPPEITPSQEAGLMKWFAAGSPTSKHPDSWSNLWKKLTPDQKAYVKEKAAAAAKPAAPKPPRVAKVTASASPPEPASHSITLHHTSDGHNKFYKVTVDGSKVTKHWGKIGTDGLSTTTDYHSHDKALDHGHALALSKQKKGYFKYDGGLPASLADAPAPKVASVTQSGPKEGDTKQGADGMLVLKHGRWVKVDQGEPAAAAPAQSDDAAPLDISGWKQVGPQAGSNPGGVFEAPDGTRYYVKFPKNPDHAKSEVLAAKLYELAGITAPISRMAVQNGKVGIASLMDPTLKHDVPALSSGKVHSVKAGFAADAWLANYDVAGLGFDNVMVKPSGQAVRIDVGASMEFRAQGAKKAFGPKVTETKTLLDPAINAQSSSMFAGITPADIAAGVAKIAAIDDHDILSAVMLHGPGTGTEKKKLADTLIARKADLLKQYPAAVKAVKKKLDPKRLPVDPARLPKAHDYANWNGPGKGLSSKAHVNAANAAVEQEMLAIAKKGDLPTLRAFSFKSLNKESGQATGAAHPISEHPSKHVVQLHQDLVTLLDEIANPPEPLKLFRATEAGSVAGIAAAFPPKKFGTTVGKVKSNEKLGFWVALGQVSSVEKFKPKKVSHFTANAIAAAKVKFKQGSSLARHFITSVQASGSYNTLFRDGKEKDHSGHLLKDVAKAALEHATSQPEGTSVYRWQNMTDAMVQQVLKSPVGTVIQATGPMCTSYDPTATQHFGKHRVTIRYAEGAKAVESFGSGGYKGEKEVTTLPNSRFVVLSRAMVPGSGGHQRLELELLMLPPDLGI